MLEIPKTNQIQITNRDQHHYAVRLQPQRVFLDQIFLDHHHLNNNPIQVLNNRIQPQNNHSNPLSNVQVMNKRGSLSEQGRTITMPSPNRTPTPSLEDSESESELDENPRPRKRKRRFDYYGDFKNKETKTKGRNSKD
eukprot:658041_1